MTLEGQSFMSGDDAGTELKLQEYREKDEERNFIWEPQGEYSENL